MFKLPAILLCNVLKKENRHLLCLINLARHEEFSVFAQCAKRKEEELL